MRKARNQKKIKCNVYMVVVCCLLVAETHQLVTNYISDTLFSRAIQMTPGILDNEFLIEKNQREMK